MVVMSVILEADRIFNERIRSLIRCQPRPFLSACQYSCYTVFTEMTRPYQLRQRAERQAETRQRIARATMELHGTVGPAQTTVSAIAEKAGVQRLTVYRHFPDERALFTACGQCFAETYPPPDGADWLTIPDPEARLRRILTDLYTYYQAVEPTLSNVLRDAPGLPVLRELSLDRTAARLRQVRDGLLADWPVSDERRPYLSAALGHALEFATWRSLAQTQSLALDDTVALMHQFVVQAAQPAPVRAPV
jgi:AcrR family transcriptional regulator